ncbi:hypothetical protein HO173_008254 [Letharia columbiana]|uniref:Uncharacterized protein n=1 Tax=Letharia columbiana TaxID=112416 RepID=A0A8H6L2Y4_9LECA|nr:uncharacterized protein HO173_008254 [Letharia columbiana]KAF6233523.1 hypothetical protein HO173_008254 [Letharia columbiana]
MSVIGNYSNKYFIAVVVCIAAFIWKAPDGSPAAEHRAYLFNMAPRPIKDAYLAPTLANMSWLAYVSHDWIKAVMFQLFSQIPTIAGHSLQFLGFFVATVYSWLLAQKPCIDTAIVWGSGIVDAADTLLLETMDALTPLHSRIEMKWGAALAYAIVGAWVSAGLGLLFTIAAVVVTALHLVFSILWSRVDWRRAFLLSITSVVGYVGYLWMKEDAFLGVA